MSLGGKNALCTFLGPRHRIDTQPEVRLPWKLVPFFLCACPKYAINTPFWRHIDAILASSPGTFDLKATFSGYESWRFVLKYEKAGGQNCRGNLPGWRIDGDDEMREATCARRHARGDMREATCARTPTSKVPTRSRTSGWLFILWPRALSCFFCSCKTLLTLYSLKT